MPRKERLLSRTGIYHVIIRGINQQRIFEQDEDFEQFLYCLAETKKKSGFTLYAYCLLGNHAHLLMKEGAEPLAQIFRRLGTQYAQWFNGKYARSGHLFQDRYRSKPVENDEYFLAALIYIFNNPIKAGICSIAEEYEWGSRHLLGKGDTVIDETALLDIVGYSVVKQHEHEMTEDELFDETCARQFKAYSDKSVAGMLKTICGACTAFDFQHLPVFEQKSSVMDLRAERVPLRQIARITGLGKGRVESWIRKG